MLNCLKDANIKPEEVDTINMHGTSTPLEDIAENNAVISVFRKHTYNININSTKSMTDHIIKAEGEKTSIESILACETEIDPQTRKH